jgi:hypothetical protein
VSAQDCIIRQFYSYMRSAAWLGRCVLHQHLALCYFYRINTEKMFCQLH